MENVGLPHFGKPDVVTDDKAATVSSVAVVAAAGVVGGIASIIRFFGVNSTGIRTS